MRQKVFSIKRKNRNKAARTIFQSIILLLLALLLVYLFQPIRPFSPAAESERVQKENGFIAVSYFGVDRNGDRTLISTQRLNSHLKALQASGYVTITRQDILDYINDGKALPEKSLFLMFEDGRRDTAIFSQKIMEQYNYKATMLTYAQNLELEDPKFLTGKDLLKLEKSSYWELGTNGYRLAYINAFDRHGNYLDQLNTYEFQRLSSYLDRNYNHYLMDYIRDKDGVPKETIGQMKERVERDYTQLQQVYTDELGEIPALHILMHSNTGQFGTNDRVSAQNEQWITQIFPMNFNREGDSLNEAGISPYDLTRMQPQAYWYTNHLLMRLWDDTKAEMAFVSGDEARKAFWETPEGQSEFLKDTIALTSLPGGRGLLRLKDSGAYQDVTVSAELLGNKAGTQTVYLRADEKLERYLSIELTDNVLHLYEKNGGGEKEIYTLDLDRYDGIIPQSWPENKLEAEISELKTRLKYAKTTSEATELTKALNEKSKERATAVAEGAEAYEPEIALSEPGSRLLRTTLTGDRLSVWMDGKPVVENLAVTDTEPGLLYLESAFSGYSYSQRNLSDDVYDGVFKNVVVFPGVVTAEEDEPAALYDNRLSGKDLILDKAGKAWNAVINWFVKNL